MHKLTKKQKRALRKEGKLPQPRKQREHRHRRQNILVGHERHITQFLSGWWSNRW